MTYSSVIHAFTLNTLILLLVFLASCKRVDKLTQFTIEFEEEFILPATAPLNLPIDISTPEIPTQADYTFSNNNTRKDLIESIKLLQLILTLQSPPGGSFDYLRAIHVYIQAPWPDE